MPGRYRSAACALLTAACLVVAPAVPASSAASGLELLGAILIGADAGEPAPVLLNSAARRMYLKVPQGPYSGRLLEFDLQPTVPKLRRAPELPEELRGALNLTTVVATSDREAIVLAHRHASGDCPLCSVLEIFDLETFQIRRTLSNLSRLVPNFHAEGIAYGEEEGRIYAVGSVGGYYSSYNGDPGVQKPTYPVSVVAVDAGTGALAWHVPLVQCQRAASVVARGGVIFRSSALDALYVPCIRPDERTYATGPGQSGLVRIFIDPDGTQTDADGFRTEFFAVSGRYTNGRGVAALSEFDYAADRLYLLSLSPQTPGAWVFDGHLSAWVGFVPATDESNDLIGVDQSTGRAYLRSGGDDKIIATEGRATPVPQGETYAYGSDGTGRLLVDPRTNRVFVPFNDDGVTKILVLKDMSPPARRDRPIDFDELTTDVPESADTFVTFAGSANGFGSRLTLVGGYGAIVESSRNLLTGPPVVPGLSPGDRAVFAGRVSSLDLRNVGASATAQAISPDTLTDDDRRTRQETVRATAGDAAAALLEWPWPARSCLDGGGSSLDDRGESTGGFARARCDLGEHVAEAEARAGALSTDAVVIGSSSFEAGAVRDPSDGLVVTAVARARNIEVDVPGGAHLTIGQVRSIALARAHGRPGSAVIDWERVIEDVTLRDADGGEIFRCIECDPTETARAINERAGIKIRMSLPRALRTATPGGAFAGVEETDPDFYNGLTVNNDALRAVPAVELVVYNDGTEKSRVVVQLAAIQASAIYGISLLPQEGGAPSIPGGPATTYTPSVPPGDGTVDAGSPSGEPGGASAPSFPGQRLVTDPLLLVRSAKEALMVSLVLLLIAGAVTAARQRLRLLRTLEPD